MADIQCGKFEIRSVGADGLTRWSARLTAVPDPIWQKAFSEEAAVSRVLGIYLGHNLTLTADIIEVSLLENSEQAVVGAIRNVIAKANSTSARYAAELQRQTDAEEQRRATAAAQMQRVRDKYPDGI